MHRLLLASMAWLLIVTAHAEETVTETLIGTPVTVPAWSNTTRQRLEKDLEIARAVMAIAPEREDAWKVNKMEFRQRSPKQT